MRNPHDGGGQVINKKKENKSFQRMIKAVNTVNQSNGLDSDGGVSY